MPSERRFLSFVLMKETTSYVKQFAVRITPSNFALNLFTSWALCLFIFLSSSSLCIYLFSLLLSFSRLPFFSVCLFIRLRMCASACSMGKMFEFIWQTKERQTDLLRIMCKFICDGSQHFRVQQNLHFTSIKNSLVFKIRFDFLQSCLGSWLRNIIRSNTQYRHHCWAVFFWKKGKKNFPQSEQSICSNPHQAYLDKGRLSQFNYMLAWKFTHCCSCSTFRYNEASLHVRCVVALLLL